MKFRLGLAAVFLVVLALVFASSAQAAFTSVYGGTIPCAPEPAAGNILVCGGQTQTWDGTKVDVNVFLPPESSGSEGPFPTIGDFHGWGGAKLGLKEEKAFGVVPTQGADPRIQRWAEDGYAVFSMSDRGWGLSCGKADPQIAMSVCAHGYNHLMDDRYEVRDAQFLISELADEGVVEPRKVGATGASYGGGISIALAALRNRTMLPDGSLVPWESPGGLRMELAAAVPQWPWSDLSYALVPNGRNLDYVTNSPYRGPQGDLPIGVEKFSWVEGLNLVGGMISNYSATDKEADIAGWLLRLKQGEPYSDAEINGIVDQLSNFHSSFGIEHSVEPSPLLIQSGWNDDLFPVDEALRFYQRTRAQFPADPISLYLSDYGHARSQNKTPDVAAFNQRLEAWFAHYLKAEGPSLSSSVEATTTTCPGTALSEGPYAAAGWGSLSPGEIRLQSATAQTVQPRAEEQAPTEKSKAFDPIAGPGACASVPATDETGAVAYSLAPAPAGGFTLMGSPTVIADLGVQSPNSELGARLLDVSPEGTESLVSRTLYRPNGGNQEAVFQLHPQGYRFAPGHVAKLELLSSDVPYGRASNQQLPIAVSNLELRLPVLEQPGSLGGLVQSPAPKVVPAGYALAAEYQVAASGGEKAASSKPSPAVTKLGVGGIAGRFSADRRAVLVPLRCGGEGVCSGSVSISIKRPGGKGRTVLAGGRYSIARGASVHARLPLSKAGRSIVGIKLSARRRHPKLEGVVHLVDSGRPSLILRRAVRLRRRGH